MAEQTPALKDDLTGVAIGRYIIVRRLGHGGMGDVYLAEDPKLKRPVALKRMGARLRNDDRHRQRFFKEAETISRLTHPHIASIHDILEVNGETFLVMEYVDGKTLRSYVDTPLDFKDLLRVAAQCADALHAAHDAGVMHRDIKPENIMLTATGSVKILDFGLAKPLPSIDSSGTAESVANGGTMSGTVAYMAPEVLTEKPADGRADLFSLGVVLYECISGQHPFLAGSFIETTHRILDAYPPSVRDRNPSLPPEIDSVLMKMLAKNPEARYQDALELLTDLQALESKLQSPSRPGAAAQPQKIPLARPPQRRSRVLLYGGLTVLLLLGLGALGWRLRDWRKSAQLTAITSPRHLAVLPFTSAGGDSASSAFSDGLSDTLTARLVRLTDKYPLEVVPASEVRSEKITTAEQARKFFGVNLVLGGQVQFHRGQVRVNYSLVNARDRTLLRAGTITAEDSNPFGVEDRVVDTVLNSLDLELDAQEREAIHARSTTEPEAYQYYLRGRGYLRYPDEAASVQDAISAFQQAIDKDQKYAMAHAGLGQAYWLKYRQTRDASWVEKAMHACERSLALAEGQADGHACLAEVKNGTGQYEQAAEQFGRAVSLDATNDEYYGGLASAYQNLNNIDKAEQTFLQAIDLRPNHWPNYSRLGYLYSTVGRYDSAEAMFKKVISLAPDSFHGYQSLGGIYLFMGRYLDAVPVLEKSIDIRPGAGAYANLGTAHFYLRQYAAAAQNYQQAIVLDPGHYSIWMDLGDAYYWDPATRGKAAAAYTRARELCQQALKVNPRDPAPLIIMAMSAAMLDRKPDALDALQKALAISPRDPEVPYYAALVHGHFGDVDSALRWSKQALDAGASVPQLRDSPVLQSLSQDRRMRAFLDGLAKK